MLKPTSIDEKIKNAKHAQLTLKRYVDNHPIVAAGTTTAAFLLASSLMFGVSQNAVNLNSTSKAFADTTQSTEKVYKYPSLENPISDIYKDYEEVGVSTVKEYQEILDYKKSETYGAADNVVSELGNFLDDSQKESLVNLQSKLDTAFTVASYNTIKGQMEEIVADGESKYEAWVTSRAKHYSGGGSGYVQNGSGLTRSGGVNWFNNHRETWYSQRELPGGGLNIPGRHVRSDGVICDGDGYVVVASPNKSDRVNGTIIDTSLGAGKAYDYCPGGSYDIYTDW